MSLWTGGTVHILLFRRSEECELLICAFRRTKTVSITPHATSSAETRSDAEVRSVLRRVGAGTQKEEQERVAAVRVPGDHPEQETTAK